MSFTPNFCTTATGSFPHKASSDLVSKIIDILDIPVWPQLPNRNFRENMYIQFCSTLPSIKIDEVNKKAYFETNCDLTPHLESFYEHYLSDDYDYFKLPDKFAEGFYNFSKTWKENKSIDHVSQQPKYKDQENIWIKGQVTGPISIGLTLTDQDLKASMYNELLIDCIIKNASMIARWQIMELRKLSSTVIIFVDEPYMAAFGSAYVSINREQVIQVLNEVFDAIHLEGAIAGVHCCANTDWSVLLDTNVDILNLDAHGYLHNLFLYRDAVKLFLDRGGVIAWGLLPNNDEIFEISSEEIASKFITGIKEFQQIANSKGVEIDVKCILKQSIITPACGLGNTTVEISEEVLKKLPLTAGEIRENV